MKMHPAVYVASLSMGWSSRVMHTESMHTRRLEPGWISFDMPGGRQLCKVKVEPVPIIKSTITREINSSPS